jgi:hypothetical protein
MGACAKDVRMHNAETKNRHNKILTSLRFILHPLSLKNWLELKPPGISGLKESGRMMGLGIMPIPWTLQLNVLTD